MTSDLRVQTRDLFSEVDRQQEPVDVDEALDRANSLNAGVRTDDMMVRPARSRSPRHARDDRRWRFHWRRDGPVVALGAFVLVIIIGAATVLFGDRSGGADPDAATSQVTGVTRIATGELGSKFFGDCDQLNEPGPGWDRNCVTATDGEGRWVLVRGDGQQPLVTPAVPRSDFPIYGLLGDEKVAILGLDISIDEDLEVTVGTPTLWEHIGGDEWLGHPVNVVFPDAAHVEADLRTDPGAYPDFPIDEIIRNYGGQFLTDHMITSSDGRLFVSGIDISVDPAEPIMWIEDESGILQPAEPGTLPPIAPPKAEAPQDRLLVNVGDCQPRVGPVPSGDLPETWWFRGCPEGPDDHGRWIVALADGTQLTTPATPRSDTPIHAFLPDGSPVILGLDLAIDQDLGVTVGTPTLWQYIGDGEWLGHPVDVVFPDAAHVEADLRTDPGAYPDDPIDYIIWNYGGIFVEDYEIAHDDGRFSISGVDATTGQRFIWVQDDTGTLHPASR